MEVQKSSQADYIEGGTVGNAVPGTDCLGQHQRGVVGGGLDYALAKNWDVFAEYRYSPRNQTITFPIAQRSSTLDI